MQTRPLKPPRTQTLVVEVEGYETAPTVEGCYPGTIRGTIRGGRHDQKSVAVSIAETPTNMKTSRVRELNNDRASAYTPPGGYITLSGAHFSGDRVFASWASRLAGPEDEMRIGLPLQISAARDAEGNPRLYRSNAATVYNVSILHTPQTQSVDSHGDLFKAVSECFVANRAALMTQTDTSGPRPRRTSRYVWRRWQDGAPMPLDEAVLSVFAEPMHTELEEAFQTCGVIDVIPVEPLRVGPYTAESIDRGHRHLVALQAYRTGGLGRRVATALRQMGQNEADVITQAFLTSLNPDKKESFGKDGWQAMWNTDIMRFFRGLEQEMPKVPQMGYAESVAVLKPFHTTKNGCQEYFLSRSRTLGPAVPRDALRTQSDPDAIKRYYNDFRDLVQGAAQVLIHGHDPESALAKKPALQPKKPVYAAPSTNPQYTTDPTETNL